MTTTCPFCGRAREVQLVDESDPNGDVACTVCSGEFAPESDEEDDA